MKEIFVGDTVRVNTTMTVKRIVEDSNGLHYVLFTNDPWNLIELNENDIVDVLERTTV